MQSPLLFPVKFKDNKIVVLDETILPLEEKYIEVRDLDNALRVLREMKTRALGQVFLFFYSCALFKDKFSIDDIVEKFKETRPTFDFSLLGEMLKRQIAKGLKIDEAVNKFSLGFDMLRRRRVQELAEILPNPAKILTICNVNGELIYLYEELKKLNKEAEFVVCETRPYLQGTRLTFWELRKNNVPVELICDNQSAILMKQGKVNCVITGADRAAKKRGIINKIGTYSLARLAKHFNIPFYALTQNPRDMDIDNVEIEERPEQEVFMFLERDTADIAAIYPCFDVTKGKFVTKCLELKL